MPIPTARRWLGIETIEVSLVEKLVATFGGALATPFPEQIVP